MRRRVPPRPVKREWKWRDYFVVAEKLSVQPSTKEGTLAVPMGAGNALQWEVTVHSSISSNVALVVQGSMEKDNWVNLSAVAVILTQGYWSGNITSIAWPWARLRLTWGGTIMGGPVILAAGIHVAKF